MWTPGTAGTCLRARIKAFTKAIANVFAKVRAKAIAATK